MIRNVKIKYTDMHQSDDGGFYYTIGFECPVYGTIATEERAFTNEEAKKILYTLDLRSWEDLPRKYARIDVSDDKKITALGNILYDRWMKI